MKSLTSIVAALILGWTAVAQAAPLIPNAGEDLLHELMMALYNDDYSQVATLVAKGAPIDSKENGVYPIHIAAYYASPKTTQILISKGANLDVQDDKFGYTPLHITFNNVPLTQLFITAGANPNLRDKLGKTPLNAAAGGYVETMKALLLSPSVDVNVADSFGWTPLMVACTEQPNLEIVKMLLNKGADKSLRNSSGTDALDLARVWRDYFSKNGDQKSVGVEDEIIKLLQN